MSDVLFAATEFSVIISELANVLTEFDLRSKFGVSDSSSPSNEMRITIKLKHFYSQRNPPILIIISAH